MNADARDIVLTGAEPYYARLVATDDDTEIEATVEDILVDVVAEIDETRLEVHDEIRYDTQQLEPERFRGGIISLSEWVQSPVTGIEFSYEVQARYDDVTQVDFTSENSPGTPQPMGPAASTTIDVGVGLGTELTVGRNAVIANPYVVVSPK